MSRIKTTQASEAPAATVKIVTGVKPGPKPGAKAAAKKEASASKPALEKSTPYTPDEIRDKVASTLPTGWLEDTKDGPDYLIGDLTNGLSTMRMYTEDQLSLIKDMRYLPHFFLRLESNVTLGARNFYFNVIKSTNHPKNSDYTSALDDAYNTLISDLLKAGDFADFIPTHKAPDQVRQSPTRRARYHETFGPQYSRPIYTQSVYHPTHFGDDNSRNMLNIHHGVEDTCFGVTLDNYIELNTSKRFVDDAISSGNHLVTLTFAERSFTAAVNLRGYPATLATLDQPMLLEYLDHQVSTLLVAAGLHKLIDGPIVSEFVKL